MAQETAITVSLTNRLDAETSHKGDSITAQVLRPPAFAGDTVQGHVSESKSGNKIHGQAVLNFNFDSLLHNGQTVPISCSIASIENSKGQVNVDEEGRVIRKTSNVGKAFGGAGVGGLIGGIAGGGKRAVARRSRHSRRPAARPPTPLRHDDLRAPAFRPVARRSGSRRRPARPRRRQNRLHPRREDHLLRRLQRHGNGRAAAALARPRQPGRAAKGWRHPRALREGPRRDELAELVVPKNFTFEFEFTGTGETTWRSRNNARDGPRRGR